MRASGARVRRRKTSVASKRAGVPAKANLDGMRELRLFGWARGARAGAEVVTLHCGGAPIAAPVWRVVRDDVNQALGEDGARLGFEIDLPPSLWPLRRDDSGAATLQVAVDGRLLQTQADALAAGRRCPARRRRRADLRPRPPAHVDRPRAAAPGGDRLSRGLVRGPARRARGNLAGRHAEPLAHLPALAPPFSARVESRQGLVLMGWALGASPGRERFELRCDGAIVAAPARAERRAATSRAQAAAAISRQASRLTYRVLYGRPWPRSATAATATARRRIPARGPRRHRSLGARRPPAHRAGTRGRHGATTPRVAGPGAHRRRRRPRAARR